VGRVGGENGRTLCYNDLLVNRIALHKVRRLVGPITEKQLRSVEYAVTDTVGVFIPATGQCGYAITPSHTHPAYSIIMSFEPDSPVAPRGIAVKVDEFACTVMSPGVEHQELPAAEFTRYVAIMIEAAEFERTWKIYSREVCGPFLTTAFVVPQMLLSPIKSLLAEFEANHPGAEEVLRGLGVYLTHVLVRAILDLRVSLTGAFARVEVQRAIELMHARYGESLSVSQLARAVHRSESHSSRLFKVETGLSPVEFLIRVRIEKARHLLSHTDRNVSEIALQCGFASCAHLSATFRRVVGVSPVRYRRSFQ
jgi:AraC family transcriptional regulator